MKEVSFISAVLAFFGQLPGQTKLDVGREVKQLTDQDRADLIPGLQEALGVTIGVTIK